MKKRSEAAVTSPWAVLYSLFSSNVGAPCINPLKAPLNPCLALAAAALRSCLRTLCCCALRAAASQAFRSFWSWACLASTSAVLAASCVALFASADFLRASRPASGLLVIVAFFLLAFFLPGEGALCLFLLCGGPGAAPLGDPGGVVGTLGGGIFITLQLSA